MAYVDLIHDRFIGEMFRFKSTDMFILNANKIVLLRS